jgi:hypothetical protein
MKVSFVLSAVLGIAAGGRLGHSQGTELGELMRSTEPFVAGFAVSEFAACQFHHADVEHARQAALLEISVHEQLRTVAHSSNVDGELGLAYVRLAVVEGQAGNKQAESHAFEEARKWFAPPPPGQELSDERLKEFLNRIDRCFHSIPSEPKGKPTS